MIWLALATSTAVAEPAVSPHLPPATMVPAPPAPPQVLSPDDVALYKEIMAAERDGQYARAKTLLAKVSDTSLEGYVEAQHFLSAAPRNVTAEPLVDWLQQYRDLAVAEKIYRLAVQHSTKK